MKHIYVTLLILAVVFLVSGCGNTPQKNYDTIGSMTFSDSTILTAEETEKLEEMQKRKEKLIEAKDEEGIAALKAEWEAFSRPIKDYISIYQAAQRNFFSSSDKQQLNKTEKRDVSVYEDMIKAAYKSRDEALLNAAIDEWNSFSKPIKEVLSAYKSIKKPIFTPEEKSLLSNGEIASMEALERRTETAFVNRNFETLKQLKSEWDSFTSQTSYVKRNYTTVRGFSIKGKWKNVGRYTYGQVQNGSIIAFDGKNCNIISPLDTYAFYADGDVYRLDCTTFMFSDTLSFTVKTIDKDNIDVFTGSGILMLRRVE